MSKQILVVLIAFVVLAAAPPVSAQDQPEAEEKVFNLIVGADAAEAAEEEVDDTPRWEPRIEAGRWNLGLTLGYQIASGTLLKHENLIYRVDEDAFYFGDIEIKAESAFNPTLRVNYNLTSWLALETSIAIAFSEYTATIDDPYEVNPITETDATAVDELGEFDRENRSVVQTLASVHGLFFPLNLGNDGRGRWHPYVTGGLGYSSYHVDSDYTDTASTSLDLGLGLGLMLIADEIITVRAEIVYHANSIELEPADKFLEINEGTTWVRVLEFTDLGRSSLVDSFGSNQLNSITWQFGVQLGF